MFDKNVLLLTLQVFYDLCITSVTQRYTMDLGELNFWRRGGWEARRGGLPSPPVVFNLDKSTKLNRLLSDQPTERRLIIRWFKLAGVLQGSWGVYKAEQRKPGSGKLSEQQFLDNQVRATRRAVANICRDLLSMTADRMVTLTYVSNQQDRVQALGHLRKFIRVMRRMFAHWQSVAVLEYQKRGAVHFHIAVSGFYDVDVLRREWQQIIGEKSIVNMSFQPDGRGNACGKLASYMGKYLAKDMDEGRGFGEHRYFRTEGIDRPKEVYYIPDSAPYGFERRLILEAITTLLSSEGCFPTVWSGPQQYGVGGFVVGSRDT